MIGKVNECNLSCVFATFFSEDDRLIVIFFSSAHNTVWGFVSGFSCNWRFSHESLWDPTSLYVFDGEDKTGSN